MMRLPPISPDDFDPSLQPLLADIVRLRGQVYNLHRVLAHSPKALQAFMGFSEYVRDTADLDARLRELAVLRTATVYQVEYEIAQHLALARRAGLTEAQIAAIAHWHETPELFDAREQGVLDYVEETAATFRVSEPTFTTLRQFLSEAEMVDLALVMGWYLLCASVLVPFEVKLEPKFE